MKIIVIEDDHRTVDFIKFAFIAGWPDVELSIAYDGTRGIDLIKKVSPDIVLLDLGLPDISGFEVLNRIRSFSKIPVIVLTVMNEESDKVKALELGADEYVVKPFGQLEIVARLKALTRRINIVQQISQDLSCGPWLFNPQRKLLHNDSFQISLTSTESVILQLLLANPGQVVTFNRIANEIWGMEYPDYVENIRVHVSRLRQKMEKDPDYPHIIFTKIGVGYYIDKTQ